MYRIINICLGLLCVSVFGCSKPKVVKSSSYNFFPANNKNIQYVGRIDFSNPEKPRFWSPGVYIKAKFEGSTCEAIINDEVLWGNNYNYLEITIDDKQPIRIQNKGKTNTISVAKGLSEGPHTVTITKNTESGIGYLEFVGLNCKDLLPMPEKPVRKLEFIGNSITCGTGCDLSTVPCDSGQWYDQHNAYMSYGPTTARSLNSQWHLTAVSGIGLIHSCCDMSITMPQVFAKINLREDSIKWDFKKYQPDAVTICLGQNDGAQDSATFCREYVRFIESIRLQYPSAQIVCLTSPMADDKLRQVLKNYLTGIVNYSNQHGDTKVSKYFFSRSYNNGCGGHPDLAQHQLIANELSDYLKKVLKW